MVKKSKRMWYSKWGEETAQKMNVDDMADDTWCGCGQNYLAPDPTGENVNNDCKNKNKNISKRSFH